MSGRVADVDVVASGPNIIFVGSATGGVWRSVDGGIVWSPIFDDQVSGYSRRLQEAGYSPFSEADPLTVPLEAR
jgi:hypothetical protein